jgi:hypothetical protein
MSASPADVADLDWIIDRLAERRAPLAPLAPVFWRPAPDAADRHRAYIEHLLTEGGALAYRTAHSVLVASPRGDGWLIDDLYVPAERWTTDGAELWNALASGRRGDDVRFVCPTYESARVEFASEVGLALAETWWLVELGSGGGEAGVSVTLPGAEAVTVGAPPVYAPPGPMLFLPSPEDVAAAAPAAVDRALGLGCAGVVVNQAAGNQSMVEVLRAAGLRPHCHFFEGTIEQV